MRQPPDAPDPRATPPGSRSASYNARLGLLLFFVYLALYGGFVGLATFSPQSMSRAALAGVNLAVVYGLGLIAAAFVLAAVYMLLCRREAAAGQGEQAGEGGR